MNRAARIVTSALGVVIVAGCSGRLPSETPPPRAASCLVGWIGTRVAGAIEPSPIEQRGSLKPSDFQPNTERGLAHLKSLGMFRETGFEVVIRDAGTDAEAVGTLMVQLIGPTSGNNGFPIPGSSRRYPPATERLANTAVIAPGETWAVGDGWSDTVWGYLNPLDNAFMTDQAFEAYSCRVTAIRR